MCTGVVNKKKISIGGKGGGGFEIRRKVEKQGEKKGGKNLQWTRAHHYRAPCPKPAFSFHANFKFREQIGTLLLRGKRSRIEAVSGRGGRGGGIAPGDGEKSPPSPPTGRSTCSLWRYNNIDKSVRASSSLWAVYRLVEDRWEVGKETRISPRERVPCSARSRVNSRVWIGWIELHRNVGDSADERCNFS